jgi:ribosomal protein S18 acetylase RimI-like enzyme
MTRSTCDFVSLHRKQEVEAFCRRNPFLHIYAIGDLDDFFWPHTTWYAVRLDGRVQQLVLLYTGCSLPTVLAYAEQPISSMCDLIDDLRSILPGRFYGHFTTGVADVLANDYRITPHGGFHKMGLTDPSRLAGVDGSAAVRLTSADTQELHALYTASYPGNWFTPRMLETGCYFGVRRGGDLVNVAGVHVYSPEYKVAALGNITTRPDVRGQGLATAATARLCQELRQAGIDHIGLNVRADNQSAIACYQKLGFAWVADYGEYTLESKAQVDS